jgi:hypothetical protein
MKALFVLLFIKALDKGLGKKSVHESAPHNAIFTVDLGKVDLDRVVSEIVQKLVTLVHYICFLYSLRRICEEDCLLISSLSSL